MPSLRPLPRTDAKLWSALTGDGRALQVTPPIEKTAGPYRDLPFPVRLQCPAVNLQSYSEYRGRTPCPAVHTNPARDGRDYWTPGPCSPPGTVGNTGNFRQAVLTTVVGAWLARKVRGDGGRIGELKGWLSPSNLLSYFIATNILVVAVGFDVSSFTMTFPRKLYQKGIDLGMTLEGEWS